MNWEAFFHEVMAAKPSHLLICGDFNVPQVDWATNYCRAPDTHFSHKFVSIIQDCMLFQHVTSPTRYREGEAPSMLDLLFTNEDGMISGLEYLPGLGKSDHIVLRFCFNCYSTRTDMHQRKPNYHKADFKRLGNMLSDMNWGVWLLWILKQDMYYSKKPSHLQLLHVCP